MNNSSDVCAVISVSFQGGFDSGLNCRDSLQMAISLRLSTENQLPSLKLLHIRPRSSGNMM